MSLTGALLAGLLFWTQSCIAADSSTLYQLVFLRPHPERKTLPQEEAGRIQSAHMANIRKMAGDGILVAAGPFGDKPVTISGLFLFKTASLDEARRIAALDPTVVERRNTVDAHAWRGPGGIGDEYRRIHSEHPDAPQNMQVHPLVLYYRGPGWDDQHRERILAAHREYVGRLRSEKKLGAAGDVEGPDDLAGVLIFQVMPDEEAQRLIAGDPAVQAGVLRSEYHRWWSADHVLTW